MEYKLLQEEENDTESENDSEGEDVGTGNDGGGVKLMENLVDMEQNREAKDEE